MSLQLFVQRQVWIQVCFKSWFSWVERSTARTTCIGLNWTTQFKHPAQYVIILSQEVKCVNWETVFIIFRIPSNMHPWHYRLYVLKHCLELLCLQYSKISLMVEKTFCTCKIVKCISLESLVQHVVHRPHGLWDLKTCAGTDNGQNVFIKLWNK